MTSRHHPHDISSRRELARSLRTTRRALGMSQQDLADDLGLTAESVGRVERFHVTDPLVPTVQRHARAMDRMVRMQIHGLNVETLGQYPHLDPDEQDRRHCAEVVAQLVAVRKAMRWTQSMLGRQMGTNFDSVSLIECGVHRSKLSTLQRYARGLGGALRLKLVEAPVADPVAIDRALQGSVRFRALTDTEKVLLFHRHADVCPTELSRRLRISGETAARWSARARAAA